MSRTFAYCRVSTDKQTNDNQTVELKNSGFDIDPNRIVEEVVTGTRVASERPKLQLLIQHQMEPGDALVVTKLDRLGRNLIDIKNTVAFLRERGISLYILQLGKEKVDVTSAYGNMIFNVMSAFAEFERDLISERTKAGLVRAKTEGKKLGKRPSLKPDQQKEVMARLESGEAIASIARAFGKSPQTILRVRERHRATKE